MNDIVTVSEYVGDNNSRTAIVYKDMTTNDYRVSVKNDSGTHFFATFENVDTAEDFAESWVMNK
jgi:hypothetical protein